jgi:hypothetical protein
VWKVTQLGWQIHEGASDYGLHQEAGTAYTKRSESRMAYSSAMETERATTQQRGRLDQVSLVLAADLDWKIQPSRLPNVRLVGLFVKLIKKIYSPANVRNSKAFD